MTSLEIQNGWHHPAKSFCTWSITDLFLSFNLLSKHGIRAWINNQTFNLKFHVDANTYACPEILCRFS